MTQQRGEKRSNRRDEMRRSLRRSVCPVSCTLDLVGDRWTLLVVRDMLCGKRRFKDFLASPERIATNILTDRLDRLVRMGLARRSAAMDREGADEYTLTNKGARLRPVLESLRDWGLANLRGTHARMQANP